MTPNLKASVLAGIGILTMTLAAGCGDTTGGGSRSLGACASGVSVASDLPLTGNDGGDGVSTQQGVKLAVDQATKANLLGGCTINYISKDDASTPSQGGDNIAQLSADKAVLGVVGPFTTDVAITELGTSNQAGLVQISPAIADPGLSVAGANPAIDTSALKPSNKVTFFRVCATETVQARALADAVATTLQTTAPFVIDDGEPYGQRMAAAFTKAFAATGGQVLDAVSVPWSTTDFGDTLKKASNEHANLIVWAGLATSHVGRLRAQEATFMPTVQLIGVDTLLKSDLITSGGTAANEAYAVAAPDPANLDTASRFVADYKAAFGSNPSASAASGYDAMNVLLHAIKTVIDANGGALTGDPSQFREKVRAAVAATSWDGVLGHVAFDANGDANAVVLGLYQVSLGRWGYYATLAPKAR